MKSRIDWIIHGCANGVVCEYFGETENGFLPGTCNFHTHGMEKYSHLDFQMTLAYPPQELCRAFQKRRYGIRNLRGLRCTADRV